MVRYEMHWILSCCNDRENVLDGLARGRLLELVQSGQQLLRVLLRRLHMPNHHSASVPVVTPRLHLQGTQAAPGSRKTGRARRRRRRWRGRPSAVQAAAGGAPTRGAWRRAGGRAGWRLPHGRRVGRTTQVGECCCCCRCRQRPAFTRHRLPAGRPLASDVGDLGRRTLARS